MLKAKAEKAEKPAAEATTISEAQAKRMFAVAHDMNVTHATLKNLIRRIAGVESSKDIPRSKYDELIAALQDDIPF